MAVALAQHFLAGLVARLPAFFRLLVCTPEHAWFVGLLLLSQARTEPSDLLVVFDSASAKHLSDALFVDGLALVVELEFVLGAAHAKNFESVDLGHKFGWRLGQQLWELFEKDVREAGTEVGSIDVDLPLAWDVNVLASGAVDLDS